MSALPPSIRRFAGAWWASTGFWMLGATLAWERTQHRLEADPRTLVVAEWMQPASVGVVIAVTALLWWLVARRASRVGKWLVIALAAIGALRALVLMVPQLARHPLSASAFLLAAGFAAWAAAALLRDDARVWFGETGELG